MKRITSLILATVFSLPAAALALGIRIPDQDAEATARGEAFTATADNPSAIFYNPAGITQLSGQNVELNTYGIYLQSKHTSSTYGNTRTTDNPQGVGQLYYAYTPNKSPISLGLGVYSPYGFALEYPDDVAFRTLGLKGSVTYITVNPVIAWKINDTLSVAVGPTFNYASTDLKFGVTPAAGNSLEFKGDGYAAGFAAGILWQPAEKHSFGITYHSGTTIGLTGHSTLSIPSYKYFRDTADTKFEFPEFIMAGYSFRPTPQWNLECDVDWTNWENLNNVVLNQKYLGSTTLPFNWNSSLMYKFGVTRYFANGYNLSAGYIYSQNSVRRDQNFNPIVPDSDRNIFSVGIGKKYDRYSWEFAYQFAYGPNRTISNGSTADGNYRFISHALTLSLGYHF
jgi:long-chain fatty acid transport protein